MANTNTTPTDGFTHWVIVDTTTGNVIAWWADADTQYDGRRSAHAFGGDHTRAARARHDGEWVVA